MANDVATQVSVVIPNYAGVLLFPKHLPAVFACLQSDDEVIIVDDASPDDSVAWLKRTYALRQENSHRLEGKWHSGQKHGRLIVLANKQNLRFAATCNIGVEASSRALIFLLNTDVSPEKKCRDVLVRRFDLDASIFAVGCLEYENSRSGQESGKNVLWFEKGLYMHSRANQMKSGSTAWVSGGSGMFRKTMWQELQGFDVGFAPAYWEDIDLSHRARELGYKVLFERSAVVLHQHETTNTTAFNKAELLRMSWSSADLFTRKHSTIKQFMQYLVWRPFWWWQRMKVLQKIGNYVRL